MRIQQLLNFMGLRQGQVARGLGLSEAHFSAICNGRRDLPNRLVTIRGSKHSVYLMEEKENYYRGWIM